MNACFQPPNHLTETETEAQVGFLAIDRRPGCYFLRGMKKLLITMFAALLMAGCGEEAVEVEFDTPEGNKLKNAIGVLIKL